MNRILKNYAAFVLLLLITSVTMAQEKRSVNAEEFQNGIESEAPTVLDVRRPDEFKKGHLPQAININWQNQRQFMEEAGKLDKSKPVYLYCLAGVRSSNAADWLINNGFTKVIDLSGGIDAWKKARKPLVKN